MSQQTTSRRRSKRLADAYDEEDGDFVFTRASKKTKIAPAAPEPTPAPAPPPKKSRKVKEPRVQDEDVVATGKKTRGRKMSFSTPTEKKNDSIVVPKRRKVTRSSTGKDQNGDDSIPQAPESLNIANASTTNGETSAIINSEPPTHQPTMISLPFSDTPIINRNKELRKKGGTARRSSLGMRGRRASSLIDNGHSAIPHREVETSEFYKHIEAEGLSEPRRMKQLLTWNGERALGNRPSHGDPDSAASLAARVIKESLLKDFSNKSEFSDWFNREDSTIPTKVVRKPNPRNQEIQENLEELESRVKRLKEERNQWKALAKSQPSIPPLFPDGSSDLSASQIDASLLDPEQAEILAAVSSTSAQALRAHVSKRLHAIQASLEFKVDQLADGVHKVEQYQETVGRVADKILALGAARLDIRDKQEKEALGTRDLPIQEVLRSLSRILPDGGQR